MAAQAKAETIEDMSKAIYDLTTAVDRLTKTNEELAKEIKRLKGGGSNNKPAKAGTAVDEGHQTQVWWRKIVGDV